MAQVSARRLALIALEQWQSQAGRADAIISQLLADAPLSRPDRGFALELFYGVLRNLILLDFWIGCLRPAKVDDEVRDVLRLGLYQLLRLGTPEHAAVNETVSVARPRARPVINGVLRNAARQREELQQRARNQPLSIRESHPEFIVSRWQKRFGPEATAALCRWNNEPPPIYARVNEIEIDREQFGHRYPDAQPCSKWPGFVQFPAVPIEPINRGHCYIQDPSTALACRLMRPSPGEKILDACAAPGGKTTYLAQMMNNQGSIVACDREPKRLAILQENVDRMRVTIVRLVQHDWLQERIPAVIESAAPFDRILLDAPCTNTGVIRRRVDVRWRLQRDDFLRMQAQQLEIGRGVARLLKPGGVLVYSTCSMELEENEMVVERLVSELPGARVVEKKSYVPFRDNCDGAFAARLVTREK
ncbi:MAG TPA: 16S rRNA (cytosine(967)-C(5))-methyltransferase RsmB [Chthoniobacterales bacterium]|nr:16S rRNA (cytosine(967)-C(5))-methyltransferase RsmB [Chthoniobacterales bacterium]